MHALFKHWWILSLRALLAFMLALCVAFVPGLLDRFILQYMAVSFMITALACYVILDSILLVALARQFPSGSGVRIVLLAQALTSMAIAVGLITVWFERATLGWFVTLSIIQSAVTGIYELIAAAHLRRHVTDAEVTFTIGLVSLAFSATLIVLRNRDMATVLNWLVTYALFFGATMLWYALRLRTLGHRSHPAPHSRLS